MYITGITIGLAIVLAALVLSSSGEKASAPVVPPVVMEQGTQVISIRAKGGYTPRTIAAKAGVPTVLHMITDGTFDCSSGLRIPSLGVQQYLPPTGTTTISLGTPGAGTLEGMCVMGMYSFAITFAP